MTMLRAGRSANRKPALGASLLAVATFLLGGCTVGPNYKRPSAPAPPAYKEAPAARTSAPPPAPAGGAWKQAQPGDNTLRGPWWQSYGDPQLNALEEKVAAGNQTLRAATEQYFQARELVRATRAGFYPTLQAGPSLSRIHQSQNRALYVPGSKTEYGDFSLAGQAAWEPDLWGRVRRGVESAQAGAQASAADLASVELSLRAELALDYFEMRGLDTERQLLDRTVEEDQRYLDLTRRRYQGGLASGSDVALAETQLEATRTQAIDISVARAQYEHAIATLIGVPASSFGLPPAPLDLRLPPLPAGVPSELLERRPDIAAAERRVQAANAQIGIAISAYYPSITLGASGGFESGRAGTWIQGPAALWSLGASAAELLFDAGQRKALTQASRDAYEASAARYRQSVLSSFQEVEDQLAALRILNDESASAQAAVAAAERSLQISTTRYKGGTASYLEVVTAQTAQLSNQRTAANVATRQFSASVQLVRALGGGWSTAQLPRP